MKKIQSWVWFVIAMVISFLPGLFGVIFTPHGHSNFWYNSLIKSDLTPAGWVFSVAWSALYFLLGIALFLVIKNNKSFDKKRLAYSLFLSQMLLNAAWSYIFFGLNMPSVALLVLMLLFIISVWMAREFYRFNRWTACCIIPYLLWMMFAFYMNAYIVLMN